MSRVRLELIFLYECSPSGVSFSRSLIGSSGNEVAISPIINIYGGVCIMKSEIVFVLTESIFRYSWKWTRKFCVLHLLFKWTWSMKG